jgi:hypothetical protein
MPPSRYRTPLASQRWPQSRALHLHSSAILAAVITGMGFPDMGQNTGTGFWRRDLRRCHSAHHRRCDTTDALKPKLTANADYNPHLKEVDAAL